MHKKIIVTKQKLSKALFDLLNQQPLTSITVSLLVKTAHVNRTTFYKYYRSPMDLLQEIETSALNELQETLMQLHFDDPKTNTYASLYGLFKHIKHQPNYGYLLLNKHLSLSFQEKLITLIYTYSDVLFTQVRDSDAKRIYLIHGSIALVQYWIKTNYTIPVKKLVLTLIDLAVKVLE